MPEQPPTGATPDPDVQALQRRIAELEAELAATRANAEHVRGDYLRLHGILMQTPVPIGVLRGPDHVFEFANPACQAIVGVPDLIGRSVRDIFPRLQNEGFFEILDSVYQHDRPWYGEAMPVRLDRQSGGISQESWFNVIYQPTHDPEGQVHGILVIATEVTTQVLARRSVELLNDELAEHEARVRLLAERAQDVIYRYRIEPDRAFEYVSPSVLTTLGYAPADFYADPLLIAKIIAPEDMAQLEQVLAGQVTPSETIELRFRHRDGYEVLTEHRITIINDTNGRPLSFEGVARDVTAARQAQFALQEREALFRAVWEHSGDTLVITDANGIYVAVNPAVVELYGYTPAELIGQSFLKVIPEERREQAEAMYREAFARRVALPINEIRIQRADGAERVVEARSVYVEREGGDDWMLTSVRDITPRKQAEEAQRRLDQKLQETQKLESLGVLAGGIAHDFNNMLVAMMGNADLALLDLPDDSPARSSVEQISTAARRAADLTRQLLAYAGKGRFVVEQINLNEIIHEMTHLLHAAIPRYVTIDYHLAVNIPAVAADVTQIRQVVMNLVINAAEAIEVSGRIAISTRAQWVDQAFLSQSGLGEALTEGCYIVLEVADTGVGMDAATLERIFDPFFTTKFAGRGLGLAAVQGIVRGHGGAILVSSQPGSGSTFTLFLPCATGGTIVYQVTAIEESISTGLVLLIDDEADVLRVGSRMLQRMGFTALTASDGSTGIDLFRSNAQEIALVLLDLTMPYLDGEQVFYALREIRPDIRVVLMSGYNQQELTSQFVGLGLAGFMQKPFRMADLRAVIDRAFGAT